MTDPITTTTNTVVPFAMNTEDAAHLLGLSPRTLEDWRYRGGGPAYRKFGKSVRYLRSDLIAFAEHGRITNTGQAALAA